MMPQIPKGIHRPNFDETIIDLLESIALEEMALANILNAEGEKLQEVIKRYSKNELCFSHINDACYSTEKMINTIIMKEWLLLNKL
ncbi:MAG: hypothetical protein ATN32_08700, partial [Candidatus Epulonipiscium fishelsonii]